MVPALNYYLWCISCPSLHEIWSMHRMLNYPWYFLLTLILRLECVIEGKYTSVPFTKITSRIASNIFANLSLVVSLARYATGGFKLLDLGSSGLRWGERFEKYFILCHPFFPRSRARTRSSRRGWSIIGRRRHHDGVLLIIIFYNSWLGWFERVFCWKSVRTRSRPPHWVTDAVVLATRRSILYFFSSFYSYILSYIYPPPAVRTLTLITIVPVWG